MRRACHSSCRSNSAGCRPALRRACLSLRYLDLVCWSFLAMSMLIQSVAAQPNSAFSSNHPNAFTNYTLAYTNAVDSALQKRLEEIDARLREQFGMATNETAVGLLDLRRLRLAMIRPD